MGKRGRYSSKLQATLSMWDNRFIGDIVCHEFDGNQPQTIDHQSCINFNRPSTIIIQQQAFIRRRIILEVPKNKSKENKYANGPEINSPLTKPNQQICNLVRTLESSLIVHGWASLEKKVPRSQTNHVPNEASISSHSLGTTTKSLGTSKLIVDLNSTWRQSQQSLSTYKSLFGGVSKHCSQNRAFLDGRARRAEADRVRGSPPDAVAPPPAAKDGELMPPPHLFRPPVDSGKSIKPLLVPDIVRLFCLSLSTAF